MSYSILIVDDSEIIRAVIKKMIGMSGMEVSAIHEAGNGREGLETLRREWVDVVFSDINMPEMNGIEMVEEMMKDDDLKSTPVVVISTERSEPRIQRLKDLGVKAYMKKPFRPEDFRDIVGVVLSGGTTEKGRFDDPS